MEIKFIDQEQEQLFKPATNLACGFDLRSTIDCVLFPGDVKKIATGIAVNMTTYVDNRMLLCGLILPRSSLGSKHIKPANAPGLIDADYHGEIVVALHNGSDDEFRVKRHDRIAQLMFTVAFHPELHVVSEFSVETERGAGGFGSTGTA